MARASTKSLAGRAASAARKVMTRPTTSAVEPDPGEPADSADSEKTTAKKTPAKNPAAKKSAAKKASTKKAPTKKAPVKKSTPKKAAPAELVVKADEDAWTEEELAEVLEELHGQRNHSMEVIGIQESELSGLMRDSGDGAGHDQADVGATTFERDHELTVLSSERDKLAQIDRALVRIDDGSYGQCESCGQPIGKMRLMAFPRATLCMTCKQREERR